MSQKANLQTIRKILRNINLVTLSPVEFSKGFNLLTYFNEFFRVKNVLINSSNLNFIANRIQLNFSVFVCSSRIKKITGQFFFKTINQIKNGVSNFILKELKILGVSVLVLKITLLNKFCLSFKKNKLLKLFYLRHRAFKDGLFARRNNLFFDLLKVSFLLSKNLVTSNLFLFLIVQLFKILPKRKHARFLLLIKKLFKTFCEDTKNVNSSISGLKFLISGKLKGKLRTQRSCIQVGKVATQTISNNIEYSKTHVFTRYGVFGFKFWIYRY